MALTNKLTNIANAIREKTGFTGSMSLDEMAVKIRSLTVKDSGDDSGGGFDTGGGRGR